MAGVKSLGSVLLAVAVIATAALAGFAIVDRMTAHERAAERRGLLSRQTELTARALVPGSPLACLDSGAGETVGNACEKAVYADAATAAAALSFTAARLGLLRDAAKLGDSDLVTAFAGVRRSIELDRFGLAAQVLTERDACTPEQCPSFAALSDTSVLKANMKARVYEQYVSRYAGGWERTAPAQAPASAPQASVPAPPALPEAAATASLPPPAPTGHPLDPKWKLPSSDSIPAVSIMNTEPPRPKLKEGAETQASQSAGEGGDGVPVPPKRPQAQAPSAAPAR